MFFDDYTDCPPTPLFAFGHGLSYTGFEYSEFEVKASTTASPVEVSVAVRNAPGSTGEEVVQLYYRDNVASVARPDRLASVLPACHSTRVRSST